MLLRQRDRDFFYLLQIYFVTFFSNYTRICTLVIINADFVVTDKRSVLGMLICVLNPWGLVGYLRFELSYAKATT